MDARLSSGNAPLLVLVLVALMVMGCVTMVFIFIHLKWRPRRQRWWWAGYAGAFLSLMMWLLGGLLSEVVICGVLGVVGAIGVAEWADFAYRMGARRLGVDPDGTAGEMGTDESSPTSE